MNQATGNLILNNQEIKDGETVLQSYPTRLIVTLSTRCNSKCIMCEVVKRTWDIPQRTIEEIKSLLPYMTSISWQGGEVLFLDYFENLFLESLKNKQLMQTIVTNGMLLNDKWIDLLTEANIELTVSIDGLDKLTYEKIRYGSKFDVLIKNLEKLNEVRNKKNSKLILKMHTVVMRSNYEKIEEFMDFAKKYGFNSMYMMPIYGGQDIPENIFIKDEPEILATVSEKIKKVIHKSGQYGINFMHSLPVQIHNKEKNEINSESVEIQVNQSDAQQKVMEDKLLCYLPWQQLNIDPGGEVRPGCLCMTNVGSVMDNSIMDIWNNEKMQQYRSKILQSAPDICSIECIKGNVPENMRRI